MNKSTYRILFFSLFCLFLQSGPAHSGVIQSKMSVAVIEFEAKGDLGIQDAGEITAEWMIGALAQTGQFSLRERVLLSKVIEEQIFQSSGLVDEKTIATRAGELYGVQAIVTGSVLKWENIISVTARLIDTQTGTILKAADVKANNASEIPDKIQVLAAILAGKQAPPASASIAPPPHSTIESQLVGSWDWFTNAVVIFKGDHKIYRENGRVAADWSLNGENIHIKWRGQIWRDTLRLYENGTVLRGTNQFGYPIHAYKLK